MDVGCHSYIKLLIRVNIPITVAHTCCEKMYRLEDNVAKGNLYMLCNFSIHIQRR